MFTSGNGLRDGNKTMVLYTDGKTNPKTLNYLQDVVGLKVSSLIICSNQEHMASKDMYLKYSRSQILQTFKRKECYFFGLLLWKNHIKKFFVRFWQYFLRHLITAGFLEESTFHALQDLFEDRQNLWIN